MNNHFNYRYAALPALVLGALALIPAVGSAAEETKTQAQSAASQVQQQAQPAQPTQQQRARRPREKSFPKLASGPWKGPRTPDGQPDVQGVWSNIAGLAGCSRSTAAPESAALFKPTATLQEIMVSVIDPNVDPIWNSVTTISTAAGTEEIQPHTDEQWLTLRHHALTLLEASNLLVIEGRKVAAAGVSTSAHPVELSPQDIQKGIEAKRPAFVANAHVLHAAVQHAITAIDAKNPQALEQAGGEIEHACEQCHSQFWYPNDKRPTASLDLGLQAGTELYLKMRKAG